MTVSVNLREKRLMNKDLELIEDYLTKRFELTGNELISNLEAIDGRYKFDYYRNRCIKRVYGFL